MENVSSRLLRTKHSCKMHCTYKRENAAQRGKGNSEHISLFAHSKSLPSGNDEKTEEWWIQWIGQEKDLVGIIVNAEEKGSTVHSLRLPIRQKSKMAQKNSCATSEIPLSFASLASINLIFSFLRNFLPFPYMCMQLRRNNASCVPTTEAREFSRKKAPISHSQLFFAACLWHARLKFLPLISMQQRLHFAKLFLKCIFCGKVWPRLPLFPLKRKVRRSSSSIFGGFSPRANICLSDREESSGRRRRRRKGGKATTHKDFPFSFDGFSSGASTSDTFTPHIFPEKISRGEKFDFSHSRHDSISRVRRD